MLLKKLSTYISKRTLVIPISLLILCKKENLADIVTCRESQVGYPQSFSKLPNSYCFKILILLNLKSLKYRLHYDIDVILIRGLKYHICVLNLIFYDENFVALKNYLHSFLCFIVTF